MDYADVHRVNSRGLAHLLLLCPTPNQQGRSGLLSARSSCTRGTETAMRAPPRGQGLVWLVPWRICLRQASPSNSRRAKSDAWRHCLAQAAFPGSDPNRPSVRACRVRKCCACSGVLGSDGVFIDGELVNICASWMAGLMSLRGTKFFQRGVSPRSEARLPRIFAAIETSGFHGDRDAGADKSLLIFDIQKSDL